MKPRTHRNDASNQGFYENIKLSICSIKVNKPHTMENYKSALPTRRPYQTRHTAATLWLAAGENPEWIARQMGHSTTEMLFRIYSRYVPNLTRQDGSAFESLLKRTLSE
jgi:integrase